MGNEHSNATSLLVKQQQIGPTNGGRMSKAQSSSMLSEMASNKMPVANSPSATKSGAYIKKREQPPRRKHQKIPAGHRNGTKQKLEKRGSSSTTGSGGSRDYSSSGGASSPPTVVVFGTEDEGQQDDVEMNSTGGDEEHAQDPKFGSHHHHHHSPQPWLAKHRKDSGCSDQQSLGGSRSATAELQKRIRSTSLCVSQMMKAECQAIANLSYQHALSNGRKYSSAQGVMPPLTRLRIQQGFRNAKPVIGHHILKRACMLRSEFKSFLNHLREEKMDELAADIFVLVTECVANVELPSKVAATSFAFGERHAQLCHAGFRPEFFSVIADATIAECVRLDGAQKRCETLLAWSQLMQFMFSNVRDGYYAEVRQQRRSSLPQQRLLLKQVNLVKQQQQQQQQCLSVDSKESVDCAIRTAIRNGSITPEGAAAVAAAKIAPAPGSSPLGKSLTDRRRAMLMQQNISFDMDI